LVKILKDPSFLRIGLKGEIIPCCFLDIVVATNRAEGVGFQVIDTILKRKERGVGVNALGEEVVAPEHPEFVDDALTAGIFLGGEFVFLSLEKFGDQELVFLTVPVGLFELELDHVDDLVKERGELDGNLVAEGEGGLGFKPTAIEIPFIPAVLVATRRTDIDILGLVVVVHLVEKESLLVGAPALGENVPELQQFLLAEIAVGVVQTPKDQAVQGYFLVHGFDHNGKPTIRRQLLSDLGVIHPLLEVKHQAIMTERADGEAVGGTVFDHPVQDLPLHGGQDHVETRAIKVVVVLPLGLLADLVFIGVERKEL
jgi:hypothetical protein